MPRLRSLASALRTLFGRARLDRDLDEELGGFLDLRARELTDRGVGPDEARRRARLELGGLEQVKELVRDRRRGAPLDGVAGDVRIAARTLVRHAGFSLVAAATIAVGIGANVTVFSVVKSVLIDPLPYDRPAERVMIWSRWVGWEKTWVSPAEVLDYRQRARTLAAVAAWSSGQMNLTGDGEPERVGAAEVTANLFEALGATPLHGRVFAAGEDQPGRTDVVVVGYGLWNRRYAADPTVVGRTLHVNGVARTVIGVMPRGFRLPTDFREDAAEPTELWVPMALDPDPNDRGNHGLYAAARLSPGATATAATAELKAITAALARDGFYPAAMRFEAFAVPVEDEIVGEVRSALWLLVGAVVFLLLIACVNVANLLLARAETRRREFAVRSALGAGRLRVVRQLLTESLVLAGASAVAGAALAWTGTRLVAWWNPASIPRADAVTIDPLVLLSAAGLALVTGLVFGIVPALRARDLAGGSALGNDESRSTASRSRQRLRRAFVVAEVALAVALVAGAGLMIRSLDALGRVALGFRPEGVLTLRLFLPEHAHPEPRQVEQFYERLLDRVRQLPGVDRAGALRVLPLDATIGDWGLDIEGFVETPGNNAKGDWQVATPGALESLGVRLVRGRLFTAADTADAEQVAVVNETMARRYWADGDPIGRRIRMGSNAARPWITVVGIVADVRHNGLEAEVREKFYRPHAQFARSTGSAPRGMTLVVKAVGDPFRLAAPIGAVVREQDPDLPVAVARSMTDIVRASMATRRFTGLLLGVFAALALALAAAGVYGLLSYVVAGRRREFGVRMAVGATSGDILRLVLSTGLWLAAAGVAIGLVLALATTRLMRGLLYGVDAGDPATMGVVAVAIGVVAIAASVVPALRAGRANPVATLRAE